MDGQELAQAKQNKTQIIWTETRQQLAKIVLLS